MKPLQKKRTRAAHRITRDRKGYVLKNSKQPNTYKVGRSIDPEGRAKALSRPTGVLGEYKVVFKREFRAYKEAEKRIHTELKQKGYHDDKEFFRGPLRYITGIIKAQEQKRVLFSPLLFGFFIILFLFFFLKVPFNDRTILLRGGGEPIIIPDPQLEKALKEALNLKDRGITIQGASKVKELTLSSSSIFNIKGIEAFTSLEALDLGDNYIQDITPLSLLKELKRLNLWGNQLTDITPLKDLTHLHWLNLNHNMIQDVSPLSQLENLKTLFLNHNRITDFSPLSSLESLNHLFIFHNVNALK